MKTLSALGLVLVVSLGALALPAASTPVATLPNVTYAASEVIELWPAGAPEETANVAAEHVLADRPRPFDQITNITVPTLSVFLPAPNVRNGTAMLVIPGGGLERLAIEHEGYEVAEWLNAHGIAAFLLKYRVPPRDPAQRWKAGLQDAQRAMSLIRSRSETWQLDPTAVGSIGFSAGAELNVMLSVYQRDGDRQYPKIDDTDRFSTRPDFNIAIYGGGFANVRANALRDDIAERIDARTPPMFIAHAFDDGALSSIILMNALKRAGVTSELHVFAAGAHGFGVRDTGLAVGRWKELCLAWLAAQGHLDPTPVRSFARAVARAQSDHTERLPRFSVENPFADLAGAYAAQHRIVRHTLAEGAEVAGYKGAFTSAAAQTANDLTHPAHGVLFQSHRLDAATKPSVALDPARPLVIETEIGYVIATDIATKLRVPRQAMTAIEAIVPVIELPDNIAARMDGAPNARDAVATNIGSHRFIVGPALAPSAIADVDALAVSLHRDGQTLHDARGADVAGGQAATLMTLINQIVEQGHILHRGDIVITGALGRAHPEAKGNYRADFGSLGAIEFELK
jgi:2-keto-4-pentenoate hydratase/acetyl esterase/lipase